MPHIAAYFIKEREDLTMNKPNKNTPNIPYGPATSIPSPELHNEALNKGSHYTGASTPGTSNNAHPEHVEGGAGHDGCDHE